MPTYSLSEIEYYTVRNALLVSANRYREDAKACDAVGHTRVAEQFEKQAKEAQAIYDRWEEQYG